MADVKFSELTALTGTEVASDDILAIVDTSASTSKQMTIDTLFGEIPVNIAVNDATDTSSGATGSIQTDGGIGIAKKLWVAETATSVGKITSHNMSLDLGAAAAATTTTLTSAASSTAKTLTLPNLTDTLVSKTSTDILSNKTLASPIITTQFSIGSAVITEAELEILDGALATTTELNTAADGSTTIGTTAVAGGDGIVTNDATVMRQTTVDTFDTYLSGTTKTLTAKTLTSPKLNEDVVVTTTATELNVIDGSATVQATVTLAAADGVVISDGDVMKQCLVSDIDLYVAGSTTTALTGKTLTTPILTAPKVTTSIQASTNNLDVVLNQFDATEVGRIHDGYVVPVAAGTTTSLTAGTGFGNRRRVLTLGSGNDDNTLTLTAADSGSIIYVTPTNIVGLILPLVGTETGQWFDIIIAAAVDKAFTIKTSGQDGADNITLFCNASDAVLADIGGSDHDILTFTYALAGSRIQIVNCAGGAAEKWHAYVSSMSTIDAAIA